MFFTWKRVNCGKISQIFPKFLQNFPKVPKISPIFPKVYPHDNFFSTNIICDICDKYELCPQKESGPNNIIFTILQMGTLWHGVHRAIHEHSGGQSSGIQLKQSSLEARELERQTGEKKTFLQINLLINMQNFLSTISSTPSMSSIKSTTSTSTS